MIQKSPPTRKVLPVIFLIDVSGSMRGDGKIDSVNTAMTEALEELSSKMESNTDMEVFVNVLKFGCSEGDPCQWMYDGMSSLNAFVWDNLRADGNTPLGSAYKELDKRLSSKGEGFLKSPSGTYAPVIILITDGVPNNRKDAAEGLRLLNTNSWFVNSERMAIAVDLREDDDTQFLDDFVRGSKNGMVFNELSNSTALIESIKGIVINTAMIGATRMKDPSYKDALEDIQNGGDEESEEEVPEETPENPEESPTDPPENED